MVQVNTFDGGLSARVEPSLLPLNQAVRLVNIDPDSAVLKPLPAPTQVATSATPNIRNFNNQWVSFPNPIDAVEWDGKLFYTDGVQPSMRDKDGNTYNLGLTAPDDSFKIASTLPSYPVYTMNQTGSGKPLVTRSLFFIYRKYGRVVYTVTDQFALTGDAIVITLPANMDGYTIQAYILAGGEYRTYNSLTIPRDYVAGSAVAYNGNIYISPIETSVIGYVITRYNEDTGFESAPTTIKYKTSAIDWLNTITIPHPGEVMLTSEGVSTHYKLYRQGYNTTKFALIDTVPINNTQKLVNNNLVYNPTIIHDTSLAEPTALGISNIKQLDTLDAVPAETTMHSIVEALGVLVGIVGDEIRYSLPARPSNWPPTNSIKLREPGTGLLVIPSGILVFTDNLTYFLTGTSLNDFRLSLVSDTQGAKRKSPKLVRNTPVWVSNDGICTLQSNYVSVLSRQRLGHRDINPIDTMVADEQYYILQAPTIGEDGEAISGDILVADFRVPSVRFYEMTTDAKSIVSYAGKAYMFNNTIDELGVNGEMKYTSPTYIDGNHTEIKSYNKIYVRFNGNFNFKMFTSEGNKLIDTNLEGNRHKELKCLQDGNRGTGCRFEITGTGTFYAIDTRPEVNRDE